MRHFVRPRRRDDSGVIAILSALVIVAVLLPIAALGLSAYTRSAVVDEQQRAADAGALHGAANLTLTNLRSLPLTGPGSLLEGAQIPSVPDALAAACTEERRVDAVGKPVSDSYAPNSSCEARFVTPTLLSSCLSSVTDIVGLALGPVTASATEFVSGLTGLLAPLLSTLNNALAPLNLGATLPALTSGLTDTLQRLLPALIQDRIAVDVSYAVAGPLDVLLPGKGATTDQQVTAVARRVFKPLLPPLEDLAVGPLADLPGLAGLLSTAQPIEKLTVTMLQTVIAALDIAVGNVQNNEQLQTLLNVTGTQLNALTEPLLGLVGGLLNLLLGPLLGDLGDDLTAATADLLSGLGDTSAECLGAVREVLGDLKDALQVNNDPNIAPGSPAKERGLLPCLLIEVFGIPEDQLSSVGDAIDCTNPIFRARLVK